MDPNENTNKTGSSQNLNESSRPLLEAEEVRGGDAIEMNRTDVTPVVPPSGEDAVKETVNQKAETAVGTKPETKTPKAPRKSSITERMTAGLNYLVRDDRNVNSHVNITFEDVLAEPDSNHAFHGVWKSSFLIFDQVKFWAYRIISAILCLPCALMWGLIFAILTVLNVWFISPLLRSMDVGLFIIHRIWSGIVRTFLDPLFQSVGQLCSNVNIIHRRVEPNV